MLEFFEKGRSAWMLSRLMGLVLIGVGLAVVLLAGLLFWAGLQTRMELQQAESRVTAEADRLAARIDAIQGALTGDAFVAAAAEMSERASLVPVLRSQGVANVLNIVIVEGAVENADLSGLPGGGFAALDMLLRARAGDDVPAQVHFAGTADEYLAIAQALQPGTENSPIALLTLPVSALSNAASLPEGVTSMRLLQGSGDGRIVLETYGSGFSEAQAPRPIDGSLLALGWHKSTRLGPLSIAQLAGFIAVGVLIVVLGVLIVRRTRPIQSGRARSPASSEPAPASTPTGRDRARTGQTVPAVEPEPESVSEREAELQSASAEVAAPDTGLGSVRADEPVSDVPESRPTELQPEAMTEPTETAAESRRPETESPQADAPKDRTAEQAVGTKVMVPAASIFRAYDIRGVVGDTLGPDVAEAIGRAIGSEARDRGLDRIAVARDGRLSGAELLAALTRGLVACGLEVIDVGAVPTPVLYYAAQEIAGGSGVMVTGSHNPPDYNGFKIVLGGQTLSGDAITALHQRLEEGRLVSGRGEVTSRSIASQYVERIASDIQLEKPLKVVADCGNGIAGAIAPRLLEAIGADVIPLYAEVDGTFPNHHPDPGDPHTLEDLKLCVRNFDADVGIAFDGDGDRLGVVAPDGEIVYPDRLMMLFARDVLSRCPGEPVIFDVKCSGLLAGEIESAGGRPVMARTGHSFIKAQLKAEKAPLAGEMSGHFFFGERWYGFDDGMYAAARLLEILAADTRASGQILGTLPKAVSTPELKVEMKEGEPHPFVEEFKRSAKFEDAEINDIDGVRADFADGFGLVRASNTTPVLVVRFEGNDKDAMERIQKLFREAMLAVNPALKLPF